MDPITIMRNALGKEEGGSGVKLEREKYMDSVKYWSNKAFARWFSSGKDMYIDIKAIYQNLGWSMRTFTGLYYMWAWNIPVLLWPLCYFPTLYKGFERLSDLTWVPTADVVS